MRQNLVKTITGSLVAMVLFTLLLSGAFSSRAQSGDAPRRAAPLLPAPSLAFNPFAASPSRAVDQGPVDAGVKAHDVVRPARLPGETVPEYLARNAQLRGNSGRLPAGSFTVNYFGDTSSVDINPGDGVCADVFGDCGLRAAIMEANALDDGSIITIPGDHTIELAVAGIDEDGATTGDLDIYQGMRIVGGGANNTIIDANGIDRVFDVYDGVIDIVDLSITGGNTSGYAPVDFAKSHGGGIWVNCGVDLLLSRVTIFGNTSNVGGGIYVGEVCPTAVNILYVYYSAIHDNAATVGIGGIDVYQKGLVFIQNSTVSENTAAGFGAGIGTENDGANFPTVTINHTTVADNLVTNPGTGAGLWIFTGDVVSVSNSILAYNFNNGVASECSGAFTSGGDNVYRTAAGCTVVASDVEATSPGLNLLSLNAPGTTPTNALQETSVALDLNSDGCPSFDQRGIARPQGIACDSGAYEREATQVQLVGNGGFEEAEVTPWVLLNGSKDKVVCNKDGKPPVANSGDCAFRFKGSVGEASKLSQTASLSGLSFSTTDGLYLYINMNVATPQIGKIKTVVKYTDAAKSKIVGSFIQTSGYQALTGATGYASANVSKIKLTIAYTGTSGKVLLDDLSLIHLQGGVPTRATGVLAPVDTADAGVIALPESAVNPVPLPSTLGSRSE